MLLKLLLLLVVLAPVPAPPPPDPLGQGYLGVRPGEPDPTTGSDLTLVAVLDDLPAARAGLRPGDVLVRLGAFTPKRFDEVREYILAARPGSRLPVTARRAGRLVELTVVVGERPADPAAVDPSLPGGRRLRVIPVPPPNR